MDDRPRNRYNESRAPLVDLRRLGTTKRWAVVDTGRDQTVAEHSHMVALIALRLAEVMEYKVEWVLDIIRFALIHDADEAWTGDMASPVKRFLDRDKIPIDKFLGEVWFPHYDAPTEVLNVVKIADLAADVLFLLDHGRTKHAEQVREEIHNRMVKHLRDIGLAPGDNEGVWRVLMDLFARQETYIDDYL